MLTYLQYLMNNAHTPAHTRNKTPKAMRTVLPSVVRISEVDSSSIIVGVTNGVVNILEVVTTGKTITRKKLY